MRWWDSKIQSATARTLESAAFFTIALLSSPSAPQFILPFLWIVHSVSTSNRTYPLSPPTFHPSTPLLYLSVQPILPPHLDQAQSDRPPGRLPRLLAYTASLRFPPLLDNPRSSSCKHVYAFPRPVDSHFTSLTYAIRYLSDPGFYRPGIPSSLCLIPPSARPIPP